MSASLVNVVVFGATGDTGRWITDRAVQAGHDVTALVRDPGRMRVVHDRVKIVRGDVLDAPSVDGVDRGEVRLTDYRIPERSLPGRRRGDPPVGIPNFPRRCGGLHSSAIAERRVCPQDARNRVLIGSEGDSVAAGARTRPHAFIRLAR